MELGDALRLRRHAMPMSTPPYDEFLATLRDDPENPRSDQLMEEVLCDSLDLLMMPDRDLLAHQEVATGDLARQAFGLCTIGKNTWTSWYAGQLHCLSRLLHVRRVRKLDLQTIAVVRGRKHARAILATLAMGDESQATLTEILRIDKSQLGRDLKELGEHGLIETAKEGRQLWLRVTDAGLAALAELPPGKHLASTDTPPALGSEPKDSLTFDSSTGSAVGVLLEERAALKREGYDPSHLHMMAA